MSSTELDIRVVPMDDGNRALFNSVVSSFEITGTIWASNETGFFMFDVEPNGKPYATKTYPDEPWREREGQAAFFAMEGDQCVGQIHLTRHWNGMAKVEDVRVRQDFRRRGVGRALLDAAVQWARGQGYQALCLETQSNNVGACRFYAAYGFLLMGIDMAVYLTTPARGETALYWYYPLVPLDAWG